MTVSQSPIRSERPLGEAPEQAYSLPSRFYFAPEVFEREREAIFFRSWQYAGHIEDVAEPGSYITCGVLDQSIIVLRDSDMTLRAFYNVCSHRAHELLEGAGKVRAITCPYHAWTYSLDGKLRGARGRDRVHGFDPGGYCLKPLQLETFGPLIFVNLDPAARPLAAQAGNLLGELHDFIPDFDRLTKAATKSWEIQANWKVIVDNFLECYHCQNAHPAFCRLVDMRTYRSTTHGIYSTHVAQPGSPDNAAYQFDPDSKTQLGVFWWLWPTMTISVGPGEPNFVLFYLKPLGPDRTLEVADYYFLEKDLSGQRKARLDYANDTLQIEDNRLCEGVQRGLRSRGYVQGRLMVNAERNHLSEHAVFHFQKLVESALAQDA